jgi:DTW domain-containing protein
MRELCRTCLQPDFSCYCVWLKPFDPKIRFVILIHPIEVRRRIATGRMAHLSLKNSRFIHGHNYSDNEQVNEILVDPKLHCVILYPGRTSVNLTHLCPVQRFELVPPGKELCVFVIDGTWSTARKMVHLSQNIKTLPRICFTPPTPSRFRVRKQPRGECYSTIEAIHHAIELLGPACGLSARTREHDSLLEVFDHMVERQIELASRQALSHRHLQR